MQTWAPVDVPVLEGSGPPLRLHDTATARVRPTAPGPTATMYVCGITPYDATHLGHAATYLAFDLVHRLWRDLGHDVHYVQNVTDIDDPLLERAARDQDDWVVLGMRETALFREDMAALRVLPPRHYIGAVEAMGEIAELVGKLLAQGAAYRVDDPEHADVYFDAAFTGRFGYESGYDEATMLAYARERGGDPDRPGKRSRPIDDTAAAANHPHFSEGRRIVGGPVHPAAERIRLRHSVEHQQRAARGVAAERAQGHALAGRMSAARIGSAEKLEAGYILQQLVELVARRLLDLPARNSLHIIDALGLGLWKCGSRDHDRRLRRLRREDCGHALKDVVQRRGDGQKRGHHDGEEGPRRPPRPCKLMRRVLFRHRSDNARTAKRLQLNSRFGTSVKARPANEVKYVLLQQG